MRRRIEHRYSSILLSIVFFVFWAVTGGMGGRGGFVAGEIEC